MFARVSAGSFMPSSCMRFSKNVSKPIIANNQSFKPLARPRQSMLLSRSFQTTSSKFADSAHSMKYKVLNQVNSFPTEDFEKYKTGQSSNFDKNFTYFVVGSVGAAGATFGKNAALTLLESMLPSADVLALANIEVDLSTIPEGTTATVKWRGRPLFVRHRSQEEIDVARSVPVTELPDPASDEERSKNPEWLIVVGICTHLGCVPLANQGEYGGWFCPCHGSHYDTSGRIRKGPAPRNLEIPPYVFLDDTKVLVGVDKQE